jgi:hypothetical protein
MKASSTMSGVCTCSGGGGVPGASGAAGASSVGAWGASTVPGMREVITTLVPSGLWKTSSSGRPWLMATYSGR